MTEQEQRIAIAEACGWRKSDKGWWFNATDSNGGDPDPPDFLHDLNAIHEALRGQSRVFNNFFNDALQKIAAKKGMFAHLLEASDYAEAFLKVKGLWLDK